jgi:glucosamine--fructose-6-phosphate aminotransferase (isomerizing)
MPSTFALLEGEYLRDLLEQPDALRKTLDALYKSAPLADLIEIRERSFRRIVLTGMGSSLHALWPAYLHLNHCGLTAWMIETSELIHSLREVLAPDTLLIAVSQSGQSAEMIRLLELPGRPTTVGITNTPESQLARQADAAILTQAGEEFSVACKTYVTSLMALEWLSAVFCRKNLEQLREELSQASFLAGRYLSSWQDHVRTLSRELKGVRDVFLAGRGASLAATAAGGLILKESARIHSEGMSSPGFRHGPFEILSDFVFVLVFAGDPATAALNQRLVQDILRVRGRAALAGPESKLDAFRVADAPESIRPILEFLSVEMMSLAFASLANRAPGKFELNTKVTTVE